MEALSGETGMNWHWFYVIPFLVAGGFGVALHYAMKETEDEDFDDDA